MAATPELHNAIRLYRQFHTNLLEINNLWEGIGNPPLAIRNILKTGFVAAPAAGAAADLNRTAVLDGLRKSAAASALLASAISQFIINLGDGASPAIDALDVDAAFVPTAPRSPESFAPNGLFGGDKKKKLSPKKKPTKKPLAPKKKPVKKPVKKDSPKKKAVKK